MQIPSRIGINNCFAVQRRAGAGKEMRVSIFMSQGGLGVRREWF